MGIDVQLKEEDGEVLAEVGDRQNALSRATSGTLSTTRLLKYLMPWGDTVFNEAQAFDLRDDVRQLILSQSGTPLADVLANVEPLIDRLSEEPGLYLWFIGD
jgi:hypothetical protein